MAQLAGVGAATGNDLVAHAGIRVTGSTVRGAAGSRVQQRATFTLTERVQAAWRAARYGPTGRQPVDTDPSTHDSGTPVSGRTFAWQEYFKVDNTRIQVYEDAKEMDETTDEVSAALDTLADSAVNPEDGSQHTFVLEIDEGQYRDQAEDIFDQVTESLDLHRQAFAIAREMLKFGDCFTEIVVDESNRLARLKVLPPETLWRNEDATGNLMQGAPRYDAEGKCVNDAGECAFDQREAMNGKVLASFYPWQIVHFRYNHRGSERYGRSLLRTARMVWKKLRASEEALVIARLQRAWMRFVHHVDTTGMSREDARAALAQYRQELTKRFILDTQLRESPFEVTSDFYLSSGYLRDLDGHKYLPKTSKIEVLQGDHAVLAQIPDIEYFQNKLFASLRVPKAYLGFERDINARATLSTQDIQFARTLRRIQSVLAQGYKEIFDFALLLAGIDPAEVGYIVKWPAILVSDEERDAIIGMYRARSDATYWQMGAPSTKFLVQERYGWDDEAWAADLLDASVDPPARLKPTILGMPSADQVQDEGAASDADAAAAAAKQGPVTDTPPDNFNQSKASTDAEALAAKTQGGKNPSKPSARTAGSNSGSNSGSNAANASTGKRRVIEGLEDLDALIARGVLEERDVWDDGAGLLPYEQGYDPSFTHGLGGPWSPDGGASIFVPGRGARRTLDRRLSRRQQLSVAGVHGLSSGGRRAARADSSAVGQQAADALASFSVNLLERKARAAQRDVVGARHLDRD